MPRKRDPVTGKIERPPHERVDMRPYCEAAIPAMCRDPRSCALPLKRKIVIVERVVDHLIDHDKPPWWVFADDCMRPENKFLRDLWTVALAECKKVKRRQHA
jgi:hypothetical protein